MRTAKDPGAFLAAVNASIKAQISQLHPQIQITDEGASINSEGRLEISKAPESIR